MRIADGVYFVEAREKSPFGVHESNVFLIGHEEMAMIDAGGHGEAAVQAKLGYLQDLGQVVLTNILITHRHWDHIGGAADIRAATNAKLRVHPLDREGIGESVKANGTISPLDDNETIEVDETSLQVIHTPGHTHGHVCFILAREGILFTGDLVVGMGTSVIGPPHGDMSQYLDSLRKLLDYDVKLICPGHGPLIKEPRRKINELIEHRLEREAQIISLLARSAKRVEDLVRDIYPELDSRLCKLAGLTVLGHLQKLEKEDKITVIAGDAERRYYPK